MSGGNAAVTACKKNKGSVWITLNHTGTASPIAGAPVTLAGPTPKNGVTDANGRVHFTDLTPGAYTYNLALPATKAHYAVQPHGNALQVSGGGSSIGAVDAHATGTLRIEVVDDAGMPQAVPQAALTANGVQALQRVAPNGSHSFAAVRAGTYLVSASSADPRYGAHAGPTIQVTVPEGGAVTARVVLPLINIVTPSIARVSLGAPRGADEVLFLRPVHRTPGVNGAPPPPPPDDVMAFTFTLAESLPGKPFTGHGTLTWDGSVVKAYSDAACQAMVHSGLQVGKAALAAGHPLWVKGVGVGDTAFTLTLGGHDAPFIVLRGPARQAVKATEINAVKALLAPELKVVLRDSTLHTHETTEAGRRLRTDTTYVDLMCEQMLTTPKYTLGATLSGGGKVDFFTDPKCEPAHAFDATQPIPHARLFGSKPMRLWMKGTHRGAFDLTLTLEDPADPRYFLKPPAKEAMGVPKLEAEVHHYKFDSTPKVAGSTGPIATYHTNLENYDLKPHVKAMSDKDKIAKGRLLHKQNDGHFGRAKLVLKQLSAGQWPAGTDDYDIVLTAEKLGGLLSPGAKVEIFDAEEEGNKIDLPVKVKVAALKGAERELWIEGKSCGSDWRDGLLELGVAEGDVGKHFGDWLRLTVVEIEKVHFSFDLKGKNPKLWNGSKKRWYINADVDARKLVTDDARGRTIEVTAQLKPKLAGVKLRFMLAGEGDHRAAGTAGLSPGWDWGNLKKAVKEKHRAASDNLLHYSALSNDKGLAKTEQLELSRFGGDKFRIGAYLDQDPHLAKYIPGHATLGEREPVLSAEDKTIEVWRKFFVQISRNKNTSIESRSASVSAFEAAFVKMNEVDEEKFGKSSIAGLVEHEKWQFETGAGTKKVICVGDHNKANFHGLMKAQTALTAPKAHLIICDVQWDPHAGSAQVFQMSSSAQRLSYMNTARNEPAGVQDPPLQGALLVAGSWTWADATGTVHSGVLAAADLSVDPARGHTSQVNVYLPDACAPGCSGCAGGTAISPSGAAQADVSLQLNASAGPWAGESGSAGSPHCLIVADPNGSQFNNTILHEMGHMFSAVRDGSAWEGVPPHTDTYDKRGGQGTHCKHNAGTDPTDTDEDGNAVYTNGDCIMYHVAAGNVTFCDQCATDLRVRDLHDYFQ